MFLVLMQLRTAKHLLNRAMLPCLRELIPPPIDVGPVATVLALSVQELYLRLQSRVGVAWCTPRQKPHPSPPGGGANWCLGQRVS